jgi:hypothetical protein
MDFMMEFMPKDASVNEETMFMQTDSAVKVLSVFPPMRQNMSLGDPLKIDMRFDRPV